MAEVVLLLIAWFVVLPLVAWDAYMLGGRDEARRYLRQLRDGIDAKLRAVQYSDSSSPTSYEYRLIAHGVGGDDGGFVETSRHAYGEPCPICDVPNGGSES